MFLCLLKYSSGKEKLNDTSIVFNWIFMPPILNVLSSSSKEALPSLHPFLIQSFCWNTELFLWNTKKVAAHFLSQKPTLYPAPLWDPDDRFRSSGTNLSSSIKTSWQFLKEKKIGEENINFFWWKKNLREHSCLYCRKAIHTSSTPQQSAFEN